MSTNKLILLPILKIIMIVACSKNTLSFLFKHHHHYHHHYHPYNSPAFTTAFASSFFSTMIRNNSKHNNILLGSKSKRSFTKTRSDNLNIITKNNEGSSSSLVAFPSRRTYNDRNIFSSSSSTSALSLFSTTTSTTEIEIDDDYNNMNFEGETVYNTITKSINILSKDNSFEDNETKLLICHILSESLNDLSYENNDFLKLYNLQQHHSSGLSDRIMTNNESNIYKNMLKRLINDEPIQYIIGKWDFYDFTIYCKKPVLCPRPETEELVDYVIKDILLQTQTNNNKKLRILDIGCGTGCISIALYKQLTKLSPSTITIEIVAIDISSHAIELTTRNVQSILPTNNNVSIIQSSIQNYTSPEKFDYIVSSKLIILNL